MDEQNTNQKTEVTSDAPTDSALTPEPAKFSWLDFLSKNFLGIAILITGILISGSIIYTNGAGTATGGTAQIKQDPQGNKIVEVSADDDPVLGNKNAKVTIIEFSDYQCPFCRSFWKDSFVQIRRDYIDTGKVKLVYRDYPLSFHPMAEPTAQASECADEQGKYWEFHDKVFAEQEKLGNATVTYSNNDLKLWASQLGLDSSKFNSCLDSGKYKDEIAGDIADGSAAGVTGTPSFFINGRFIVGAQPYSTFKAIIEEELKK